jgi:DTW domain-containing protein YfiP
VLIIQHPLEEKHPFNTGRIAQLCLANSEIIITETLSEIELEKILRKPSALLYPSLEWMPLTETISENDDKIKQLIVIDANWRKSKKMLHQHPKLQQLPRLSLAGDLKSNYQIRSTQLPNALSTIESIIAAMEILEPTGNFQALLAPFNKMVETQQSIANEKVKSSSKTKTQER